MQNVSFIRSQGMYIKTLEAAFGSLKGVGTDKGEHELDPFKSLLGKL